MGKKWWRGYVMDTKVQYRHFVPEKKHDFSVEGKINVKFLELIL